MFILRGDPGGMGAFLVESMLVSLIVYLPENNGMYIVFCACVVLMVCANPPTWCHGHFHSALGRSLCGGDVIYMLGFVQDKGCEKIMGIKPMQQTLAPFIAQFKETGNYWIDSGLISLFRAFNLPDNRELARTMGITIRTREFTVEGKSEEYVIVFIKNVVDNLVNGNYITDTQNKDIHTTARPMNSNSTRRPISRRFTLHSSRG